jgi:hypothetical protein
MVKTVLSKPNFRKRGYDTTLNLLFDVYSKNSFIKSLLLIPLCMASLFLYMFESMYFTFGF